MNLLVKIDMIAKLQCADLGASEDCETCQTGAICAEMAEQLAAAIADNSKRTDGETRHQEIRSIVQNAFRGNPAIAKVVSDTLLQPALEDEHDLNRARVMEILGRAEALNVEIKELFQKMAADGEASFLRFPERQIEVKRRMTEVYFSQTSATEETRVEAMKAAVRTYNHERGDDIFSDETDRAIARLTQLHHLKRLVDAGQRNTLKQSMVRRAWEEMASGAGWRNAQRAIYSEGLVQNYDNALSSLRNENKISEQEYEGSLQKIQCLARKFVARPGGAYLRQLNDLIRDAESILASLGGESQNGPHQTIRAAAAQ